MRLPGSNRRRFLSTSLTAVSAARLGLRLGEASGAAPRNPWYRYPSDASLLSAGEVIRGSRTKSGCILNYGHIATRCMVHTAMVVPFTEMKA